MKLFHYTLGNKVASIFESGVIRTSPRQPRFPEKPIAWLSANDEYEKTALKMGITGGGESRMLSIDEMALNGQGIFRFVFDTEEVKQEILHWPLLKVRSKAKPKINKRLLERAKSVNVDPMQWYGTLGEDLPICTATLEKGEINPDGSITWVSVDGNVEPADDRVLQVTVQEAKNIGLDFECSNEAWKGVA